MSTPSSSSSSSTTTTRSSSSSSSSSALSQTILARVVVRSRLPQTHSLRYFYPHNNRCKMVTDVYNPTTYTTNSSSPPSTACTCSSQPSSSSSLSSPPVSVLYSWCANSPQCVRVASSHCSRCGFAQYCSRACQQQDWPRHKRNCGQTLIQCLDKEIAEETKLRNENDDRDNDIDPFHYPDVFNSGIGHFWGILETRNFMRSMNSVRMTLTAIHSRVAYECVLRYSMDMLYLCRGDNMGVRNSVPFILIACDRYIAAYDFIAWYEFGDGNKSDYDWGDMNLPYLSFRHQDMSQNHAVQVYVKRKYHSADILIALLFLKLLLLQALQQTQQFMIFKCCIQKVASSSSSFTPVLPTDSLSVIHSFSTFPLDSFLPASRVTVLATLSSVRSLIVDVVRQIQQLLACMNKHNSSLVSDFMSWQLVEKMPEPDAYSMGDRSENIFIIHNALPALKRFPEIPHLLDNHIEFAGYIAGSTN